MLSIHDFLESNRANNITIQRALREIDARDLSHVMLDLSDEDREIIFRNMSQRAVKLLKEEMESIGDSAPEYRKRQATEYYLLSLAKHVKYMANNELDDDVSFPAKESLAPDGSVDFPEISTYDEEDILDSFISIRKFAQQHGILALQGIERQIEDPVMRRGIEYYIDGWDPLLIQTIMEKYKKIYLQRVEKRLDMIIEGLDSMASGDLLMVTEERLKTFL